MKIIKILILSLFFISNYSNSQSVSFKNHTVDLFVQNKPSPTILYIPGCNGLDSIGIKYQNFHREEFKKIYPESNFVIVQIVNDITKGEESGQCHWSSNDPRLNRYKTWHKANYIVQLGEWIKTQNWSNGDIHVFGFSYGGRIGLWLSGDRIGKSNLFKSVSLIWPNCTKKSGDLPLGSLHTPTTIWSTENDPLSEPKNCSSFYSNNKHMLNTILYKGSNHSWFTHPSIAYHKQYWPTFKVNVVHQFDQKLFDTTMKNWKFWIDSIR